ncbi:MAG: hypothetical protein WCL00_02270 [Bacteroidota bacterium]
MKRILILITLCLVSWYSYSQKQDSLIPHKGFYFQPGVAFGATFTDNNPTMIAELSVAGYYRFSRVFSIGAGVSTYNTEMLNLFLIPRFNLISITNHRSHFPFLAIRGGYSWSTWTGDQFGDDKGPIIDLMLGWSFFSPKGKLRWNVYLSPGIYQFEFIPKAGLCFEL